MDIGGSSESHEERGAEKMMDDYLKSIDLHRKKIAKDGSCLFRAVAEQVLHCQSLHTKVRAQCVEFLRKNRQTYEAFIEGDFEDYLHKLQDPQQWVGEVEINALAVMYKRDFLIFQEPGKQAVNITSNNFTDTVMLCFLNGNHYDSVYPISHLKNSALCQSILYELLYDGVFKVDQSVLAQSQRAGRNDVLSDDNLPVCGSSDESDTDPGEALWVESEGPAAPKHNKGRGRRGTHLPERVRRSLNPSMFRNIEYDIWHKTKRAQQKMDYHIAAGMQFSVGDRCKVCLDGSGRGYIATIKQLSPDNGLVTVYSEDFGQNEVPLWNLRPPTNEAKSWSVVASREKRIGNGHGDWEGRGRGRGKHTLASSSAVTGLGSNGRVMKQQSWPPLAPGEEQAGGKTRRSVSTVDSSFGLTEEQRLAKEEEERNIALVEIQRRDEHSFPALGTPTMGDGGRKKAMDKKRAQRTKTRSPVEDIHVEAPSEGRQPRPASPTPPTAPPTARVPSPMVSAASALVIEKPPAAPPTKSDSSKAQLNGGPAASSPAVAASSTSTTKPFSASHAARPTSPLAAAAATTTKPSMVAVGGAVPLSSPSTAPSPSFLTPILPVASSPPTSGALSSSSPTPSSSSISGTSTKSIVPLPPTFIAPVAPFSTQGFLPHNSGPGSSVAPHSVPSSAPHPLPSSTPHHLPSSAFQPLPSPALNFSHSVAAQIHSASSVSTQTPTVEATVAASQTPQIQSKADYVPSLPPSQTQASVTREDPQPSTALNQSTVPQMLLETKTFPQQSHPLHMQHQSVPHAEVASVPDTQSPSPSVCHCSSQAPVSHLEPHSNPPPDASYHHHHQPHPHHTAQSTVPSTAAQQLPPSVVYSHPSTTSIQLPLHSQIPVRLTDQPEMALPSANPQPHLHAHPQHSAQHTHQPPVMPALPPPLYSQSIPGVVPLQQLSQLYQDPLYPGFPQGEKGSVAPIPPFSSCKFGEDLPQDKNILRFFYNLGVKAYSMPMYPPCIYLLPLQQTHTMHPQRPSRSPSPSPTPAAQYSTTSVPAPAPLYSSANHPVHHQEAYPQQQYPPPSLPSHFEQAPIAPQHTEVFHSTRYPVTEPSQQQQQQQKQQQQQQQQQQLPCLSLPWQQQQISPANSSSFPVSYPSSTPHYPLPQQISQGYHPSQGPGVPLYTTGVPVYPHTTLGYQPSPARVHEEPQVNLEVLEKSQHTCGPAETVQSAMAASLVNTNSGSVVLPGFAVKKDPIESANRAVLLVDPTLNSKPMLVSNSVMKDVPVAMTTVKSSSTPGSPLHQELLSKTAIAVDNSAPRGYQGHQQLLHPTSTYTSLGGPEPSLLGYPPTVAGPTSVGCNTNEDWEEETQGKQTRINHRGVRRNYRGGGRWRGNYDPQRGAIRKRCEGDTGPAHGYTHYSSSHRGRGRGY